jgi:flagellar P-ring protein FlgI
MVSLRGWVRRSLNGFLKHLFISRGGLLLCVSAVLASSAAAQDTFIRDLTLTDTDVPYRLVGYGLVTGLDGTGDRVVGSTQGGMTVRSVVNMLRRFGIEVPPELLRSRNVAAVVVTSETSPYARPGVRLDVSVSSIGDATSLRGGVLFMTPLQLDLGGASIGTAQGPVMIADGYEDFGGGRQQSVETTARIPLGAVLEQPLPQVDFTKTSTLMLRNPDLATAQLIVGAINSLLGSTIASLLDPGAIGLALDADPTIRAELLTQIGALSLIPVQRARVLVDGRAGTVVAGGDIQVGAAVVSHGGVTISIGGGSADGGGSGVPGTMRFATGASVQDVVEALHAVATPASSIAAIFTALREVGAITAQVIVR